MGTSDLDQAREELLSLLYLRRQHLEKQERLTQQEERVDTLLCTVVSESAISGLTIDEEITQKCQDQAREQCRNGQVTDLDSTEAGSAKTNSENEI
jgi:hypothetical protein